MTIPFSSGTNSQGAEQKRADLYMRMYKYAAEDFVSTKDFTIFEAKLYAWMQSVEIKLQRLFTVVSNHTHPLIPHKHDILPHFHTSSVPGSPTSPNIPLFPNPNGLFTELSKPYIVARPVQSSQLLWRLGNVPKYVDTTGTIPNLIGNNVTLSGKIGVGEDPTPHLRRTAIIPILLTPNVPEYAQSLI